MIRCYICNKRAAFFCSHCNDPICYEHNQNRKSYVAVWWPICPKPECIDSDIKIDIDSFRTGDKDDQKLNPYIAFNTLVSVNQLISRENLSQFNYDFNEWLGDDTAPYTLIIIDNDDGRSILDTVPSGQENVAIINANQSSADPDVPIVVITRLLFDNVVGVSINGDFFRLRYYA